MQLPDYVKPYPKVVAWMLSQFNGNSFYPFIFLKLGIYEDLKSDTPQPKHLATLAHELHHRRRQQEAGWLAWNFRYLFFRRFRFEEELSAYRITMMIRKYYGEDFDISQCAKALSSATYLWSASYSQASQSLTVAWSEVKPASPNQLLIFE